MVDVAGLGNSCADTLLRVDRVPAAGEAARVRQRDTRPGGQIAGALAGCARLGLSVEFALRCGDDAAGEMSWRALAAAGVGLGAARRIAGVPSGAAVILVDDAGRRAVFWRTDPRLAVQPEDIAPAWVGSARALLLDGMDGAACRQAARLARAAGIPVVADLDRVYSDTRDLLPLIDHLLAPEEFVLHYGPSLEAAMAALAGRSGGCVVATQGERGALALAGGAWHASPAFAVKVADTTGAGDAFHAGYLFGLLQDWDLARRLRFANATAACACTALGAQTALPERAAVEALLATRP